MIPKELVTAINSNLVDDIEIVFKTEKVKIGLYREEKKIWIGIDEPESKYSLAGASITYSDWETANLMIKEAIDESTDNRH